MCLFFPQLLDKLYTISLRLSQPDRKTSETIAISKGSLISKHRNNEGLVPNSALCTKTGDAVLSPYAYQFEPLVVQLRILIYNKEPRSEG